MQCPKCQDTAEDFQTSAGVTVNFCQGCKGLWFDEGEFARYCQTASDLAHLTSRLQEAHPTSFTCPRCLHSLLLEIPYQKGGALLIDWCPACHGVWLDAGELQHIQRLAHTATSREKLTLLQTQLVARSIDHTRSDALWSVLEMLPKELLYFLFSLG